MEINVGKYSSQHSFAVKGVSYIGAHDNIARGSGGDTIIEDSVKMDALVHIGHDVHLHKNVEITAGVIVGGFTDVQEGTYINDGRLLKAEEPCNCQSICIYED